MRTKASRYHDISCGHRVVGHENKCRFLHGHNYCFTFYCEGQLDDIGRVIDFGVIKQKLCMWLEDEWDHKFLAWEEDPVMRAVDVAGQKDVCMSIVFLPFNPTAENMAEYLLQVIAPEQLGGTGVICTRIEVEETRKCSASAELEVQERLVSQVTGRRVI